METNFKTFWDELAMSRGGGKGENEHSPFTRNALGGGGTAVRTERGMGQGDSKRGNFHLKFG